jgi:hypothetical protein
MCFYFGLNIKFPSIWTWLNWTVFGLFAMKDEQGIRGLSNRIVIFQVCMGVIIIIAIQMVYFL